MMISQLFLGFKKCIDVGDSAGFILDTLTPISCIDDSFSYAIEKA
jgi:hypothetical protein